MCKGNNPHLGDLLTMVINHLLTGMILQEPPEAAEMTFPHILLAYCLGWNYPLPGCQWSPGLLHF